MRGPTVTRCLPPNSTPAQAKFSSVAATTVRWNYWRSSWKERNAPPPATSSTATALNRARDWASEVPCGTLHPRWLSSYLKPVSAARSAAFDILLRAERESSYASELLHSATYEGLSRLDHALATELVMGVLRWRSRLDADVAIASSQPLSKLDLEILIALRLALYQFRWLDRVPQRAALYESVELVERWARAYGLAAALEICEHDQAIPVTAIRLRVRATGTCLPEVEQELLKEGITLRPGALLASA